MDNTNEGKGLQNIFPYVKIKKYNEATSSESFPSGYYTKENGIYTAVPTDASYVSTTTYYTASWEQLPGLKGTSVYFSEPPREITDPSSGRIGIQYSLWDERAALAASSSSPYYGDTFSILDGNGQVNSIDGVFPVQGSVDLFAVRYVEQPALQSNSTAQAIARENIAAMPIAATINGVALNTSNNSFTISAIPTSTTINDITYNSENNSYTLTPNAIGALPITTKINNVSISTNDSYILAAEDIQALPTTTKIYIGSSSYTYSNNRFTIPVSNYPVSGDFQLITSHGAYQALQQANEAISYARPYIGSFTLSSSSWVQEENTNIYKYNFTTSASTSAGGYNQLTTNTKIDLQPDDMIVKQMIEDGIYSIYAENNNKAVTIYSIGAKPTVELTIQATLYETRSWS